MEALYAKLYNKYDALKVSHFFFSSSFPIVFILVPLISCDFNGLFFLFFLTVNLWVPSTKTLFGSLSSNLWYVFTEKKNFWVGWDQQRSRIKVFELCNRFARLILLLWWSCVWLKNWPFQSSLCFLRMYHCCLVFSSYSINFLICNKSAITLI